MPNTNRFLWAIACLYALDRFARVAAVLHFFARPAPPPPARWPAVSLLQPLTRGASDLVGVLGCRARLEYHGNIQHLLICDASDASTLETCRALLARAPQFDAQIVTVDAPGGVAGKIEKLLAALPHTTGEVLVFVDDDVLLRPSALCVLLPYLKLPGVGAAFGLACYTNWRNVWSSLMSAFVNANALPTYVPASYLLDPFTITGHCYALRREVFMRAGGLAGMHGRCDDDHDLARRVRLLGLRCVQTPLVYDVHNDFNSYAAYAAQIKRWFVLPRQTMLPFLTPREQALTALSGADGLLPSLVLLGALLRGRRGAWGALMLCLLAFGLCYAVCDYLAGGRTPPKRWLLLPVVALLTPLQAARALWSDDTVQWRGRMVRVLRDGRMV